MTELSLTPEDGGDIYVATSTLDDHGAFIQLGAGDFLGAVWLAPDETRRVRDALTEILEMPLGLAEPDPGSRVFALIGNAYEDGELSDARKESYAAPEGYWNPFDTKVGGGLTEVPGYVLAMLGDFAPAPAPAPEPPCRPAAKTVRADLADVEPAPAPAEPRFAVGDKVRITGSGSPGHRFEVGEIGTVFAVRGDLGGYGFLYDVVGSDGDVQRRQYVNAEHLEPAPRFSVGDRVVARAGAVTWLGGDRSGDIGTVLEVVPGIEDFTVRVDFSESRTGAICSAMRPEDLRLLSEDLEETTRKAEEDLAESRAFDERRGVCSCGFRFCTR